MLIKYLNDLDRAVQRANAQPGLEQYFRCVECVDVLEAYLSGQMEPLRRKGREIMDQLLPAQYDEWLASVNAARQLAVASRLAGSLQ